MYDEVNTPKKINDNFFNKETKLHYDIKQDDYNQIQPDNFNINDYIDKLKINNIEFNLNEIKNVIIDFCLHKDGCRFIQDKIENGNNFERNLIFEGIHK